MRKVLIETRMNSLKLNESTPPKKGCLGRLEGICADFKNPTRNGRLYPLNLWKKVFDNELFKESLESKTLFGELDHPEDRFEPLMSKACVVMTDYRIDEDAGVIYAGFDILDTPDGRTLKSILDYGSVVGVSSRGQGDIIEDTNGEIVDEDSYDFACFDVVSTPAVEKARQTVAESLRKKNFKESVEKQIKDAETIADLNIIRSVVRTSDIKDSDMDTIIESIEDRCKSLQNVGETITAENSGKQDSCNTKTVNESANTIRENKKLYKCITELRSKVSAYKHRESRYVESIAQKNEEIELLNDKITSLKEMSKVLKRNTETMVNRKNMELESATKKFDRQLNTSKSLLEDATSSNRDIQLKNRQLLEDMENLKEDYEEKTDALKSQIISLQEELTTAKSRISDLQREARSTSCQHQSEISSIDAEVEEYSALLNEAQQKISSSNQTITELKQTLKESQDSLNKQKDVCTSLTKNLKKYQECYTRKVSGVSGIDPKSIYHSINTSTTPEQIDRIVESCRDKQDRYNKLGIANVGISDGNIIVENVNNTNSEEKQEENRLMSFLTKVNDSL